MILGVWEVAVQEGFIATGHVCWAIRAVVVADHMVLTKQCLQWGLILTLPVKASLQRVESETDQTRLFVTAAWQWKH